MPRYPLQGISALSQLTIDADKDWATKGISNIKELAAAMVLGDLVVRGPGGVLVRLSPGVANTVLTSSGPGALPTWAPGGLYLNRYFPATLGLSAPALAIVPIDHSYNKNAPITTRLVANYDDDTDMERIEAILASVDTETIIAAPDHTYNKNAPLISGVEILVDGFVEERAYDYGSHDAADSATVMTDSVRTPGHWVVDALIGKTIYNITDGSSGVITDNDEHTVTVAALAGGADNKWQAGDTYMIRTDHTAQARSSAAGDCNLVPMSPLLADKIYIGSIQPFWQAWLNMSQTGAGNWANTVYYWNGAWTVTVDEAGDTDYQGGTGWKRTQHTPQGDWALTTIMGMNLYWLKIETTAFVNQATAPLATQMFAAIST